MNAEFYETECIEDALMDLLIDRLHDSAALEQEDQTTAWVSSSADRATAF
tara:strand:- start:173 stop:322 length:150 start_codon:yes stop_codon:yes gene_type:complete